MSDNADIANDIAEEALARALANRPRTMTGVSAIDCIECDNPIEPARRKVLPGVQTCAECAQLIEDEKRFINGGRYEYCRT